MDEFGAIGAISATDAIGATDANPYILGATMSATIIIHHLVLVGRQLCWVNLQLQ